MRVWSNLIRGVFAPLLILITLFVGPPFEGLIAMVREGNVVDLLYKAQKSGNVVDSLFTDLVVGDVDEAQAGTADAMLVFNSKTGTSTMQYRVWDGSAWGSQATTSDFFGSEIRHAQMKYAPTRDEAVLVVLTNTGQVQAQIYDGSSWGDTTILATLNDANGSPDGGSLYRGFDVEYEQASGDAIVVSGDGTADPNYHVWNGTSWSLNNNIDIPTTGRPYWIELASPLATTTTDVLAMITLDSNNDVYGMRWTGSSWDNMGTASTWDAAASIGTRKAIDVAFETGTGDIMFLWGDSVAADDHNYKTYTASTATLSANVALPNANAGGQPYWIRLASNPTSGANADQIMLGTLDSADDLSTFIWSGTAWSAVHAEHSAAVENADLEQDFEIVFETHASNADDAWLLWNNGATVSRKLWSSSAWAAATTVGDDNAAIVLNAHPNNGAVLAGLYEDDTSASDDISEIHLTGGSQTWSALADFWTGPVARNIGAIRMAQATQSYGGSNEAMIAYVTDGSTSYPQYSRWDGAAWSSVASTSPTLGEIRHMVLKAAPTRDEQILVTLGHTGKVEAQIYSGESGAWGSPTLLTTMNNANGSTDVQSLYRGFDVEYESASGDAIVVAGDSSADPNYHVWNGTSWSLNNNIDIPTTGRPNWIEMAAPLATTTNDALAFISIDSAVDVYGMRWTGSAWNNMGTASVWDATGAIATEKSIDVAFETGTGDIMYVWGDTTSTDQYYRTYSGGTLSAATLLDNAQAGAINNWVRLAANPTSGTYEDQIMLALLDGGADLNTFVWSGTAWSAVHTEHTAGAESHASQVFDIAYETHSSNPDDAWLVYGDGATVSRKLWNGATQTWGSATTQGDDTDYIALNAHPNTGAFFLAAYESSTSASDDVTQNRLTGGTQTWPAASAVWGGPVGRTGLPLTQVAIASDRYQSPTFEQAAYRLFNNTNTTDVGSALASQDTSATLGGAGDAFRLRMLLHIDDYQLPISGTNFKLQYAEKSGTCDTSFTGETYADVTGATPIAFNDNGAVSDGDALTANANDPTHGGDTIVNQDYEEANNFTNSEAAIPSGQDGKWDFALIDNSAPSNTSYCLRVVKSGGVLLDTYTVIPEVTTANGGNSLPTASAASIDSGASSVTLTENTTKNIICEGTVTDTDGYADISHVGAFLYRSSVGTTTASDENNLYRLYGDSECVPSGGAGNSETYTCTFPVWYYADPTDSGSDYEADNWICELHPADSIATGTPAIDTIEMASLQALNVTSSIAYGTVNPATDTGASNQQVTITNTGNVEIDPQLSGTSMTDGGSGSISASQQKYDDASFTYSSGGTALSGTPTTLNLSLPQRTSTEVTDVVYWGLGVPNGTPDGGYTGTNTFTATTPYVPSVLAFVQDTEVFDSGSAPATTAAFPSDTTSGNLIVVAASWDGCGNAEITDSKSNTYVAATVKEEGPGSIICSQIFYAENITGGASHTVTISATSGTVEFIKLVVHEVSGAATSGSLDQVASGTSSGASQSIGPVTTTTDGQYIFATASEENQSNNNFSASGVYTERETADDSGSWQTQTQDYVQPSAGSISATWTASSGSSESTVQMATFK